MKHLAIVFLIGATCCLSANTATPPATSIFTRESAAVEAAYKVIQRIEHDYETAVRSRNATNLNTVLAEVKHSQATIKSLRSQIQIHTEAEHFDVSFYERILLECLAIRTGIYSETLKTIAQEILGAENGISEFPVYQFSDKLEAARVLVAGKFQAILKLTQETDSIMAAAARKNIQLTFSEKRTISSNLDELVKQLVAVHSELAGDFASELEVIHQHGRALRLNQQVEVSTLIDEIAFVMHFITEFQILFKRIDNESNF